MNFAGSTMSPLPICGPAAAANPEEVKPESAIGSPEFWCSPGSCQRMREKSPSPPLMPNSQMESGVRQHRLVLPQLHRAGWVSKLRKEQCTHGFVPLWMNPQAKGCLLLQMPPESLWTPGCSSALGAPTAADAGLPKDKCVPDSTGSS